MPPSWTAGECSLRNAQNRRRWLVSGSFLGEKWTPAKLMRQRLFESAARSSRSTSCLARGSVAIGPSASTASCVWLAGIVAGEPTALEHVALRWLGVDELHDVEWVPADLPIVDRLAAMMLNR